MHIVTSLITVLRTTFISEAILIIVILNIQCINTGSMPSARFENDTTTCNDFSRYARFSPYTLLSDEWMVFYYWGPPQSPKFATFIAPTTKQIEYLKFILDDHVLEPINWTARMLVMKERNNNTYLLVERNDRGHYFLYEPFRGLKKTDVVRAIDIRVKQTGDAKYFAIMTCDSDTVHIFSKTKEVPKKDSVQDEAAKLGYRGRGGRSYLYQGHSWMPMSEADDEDFEHAMKYREYYEKY